MDVPLIHAQYVVDVSDISIFSARGGGRRSSRRQEGGGGSIFIENSKRGGGSPGGGGAEGAGGCLRQIGVLGRGGAKYFFSGPKCPPRIGLDSTVSKLGAL